MKITIDPDGVWYHGSPAKFCVLAAGSIITQWRALAEAFSHKPTILGYNDDGSIFHNDTQKEYLYVIDEDIAIGRDIYQHQRTTMDENTEFLTRRSLAVKLVQAL